MSALGQPGRRFYVVNADGRRMFEASAEEAPVGYLLVKPRGTMRPIYRMRYPDQLLDIVREHFGLDGPVSNSTHGVGNSDDRSTQAPRCSPPAQSTGMRPCHNARRGEMIGGTMRTRHLRHPVTAIFVTLLWLTPATVESQTVEWPSYAHDVLGTKYSPLDQIDASNVGELEIVWRQPVIPDAIRDGDTSIGTTNSQNTPLMAGGLLYVGTGFGTVAALDPTTGEVVWNDDVPVFKDAPGAPNTLRARRRILDRQRRCTSHRDSRPKARRPQRKNRRTLSRFW